MKLSTMKSARPFKDIFRIDPDVLQNIQKSISKEYDSVKPVIIWKEKSIILDGYTRVKAAKETGLTEIPAVEKSFKNEKAALLYAIECQTLRRNLTDGDVLRLVAMVDQTLPVGGDRKSEQARSNFGNPKIDSRDRTAKIIHISKDKVSKCRCILYSGDEVKKLANPPGKPLYLANDYGKWGQKLIGKILNGNVSLNQGYNQIQDKIKSLKTFNERDEKYNFRDQEIPNSMIFGNADYSDLGFGKEIAFNPFLNCHLSNDGTK